MYVCGVINYTSSNKIKAFDALHFYTAPGLILLARLIVSNVTGGS